MANMSLVKRSKAGKENIDRVAILLKYLYSGGSLYYDQREIKMDGAFNPYIVGYNNGIEVPLFIHESFWYIITEIANEASIQDMLDIKNRLKAI